MVRQLTINILIYPGGLQVQIDVLLLLLLLFLLLIIIFIIIIIFNLKYLCVCVQILRGKKKNTFLEFLPSPALTRMCAAA